MEGWFGGGGGVQTWKMVWYFKRFPSTTLSFWFQFGLGLNMDPRRGEFAVLDLSTTCFMNLHNCTEGATISLWYKVIGQRDDRDDGAVLFSFRETDTSTETYPSVLANDVIIGYAGPCTFYQNCFKRVDLTIRRIKHLHEFDFWQEFAILQSNIK